LLHGSIRKLEGVIHCTACKKIKTKIKREREREKKINAHLALVVSSV
jgi:hypothetical protein